jgi:hypothetical protein
MAGIGRAEADHAGQRQQIGYIRRLHRLRRFFLDTGLTNIWVLSPTIRNASVL